MNTLTIHLNSPSRGPETIVFHPTTNEAEPMYRDLVTTWDNAPLVMSVACDRGSYRYSHAFLVSHLVAIVLILEP